MGRNLKLYNMDFIQQAFKGHYEWWRYLIGTLIIFLFWQILGVIPLMGAIFIKYMKEDNLAEMAKINDTNIMTVFDSNTTLLLMLLIFAIGMIGVYIVIRYLHNLKMTPATTSRKKIDWKRIWFGFGLIALVTIAMTIIDYNMNPDDYVVQFDMIPFLIMAVIAVLFVPIQTSMEEYLFRGYYMQGLGVMARNRWVPLIVTSFIFGMMHFWNPEVDKLGPVIMVYYIGTGLFLGIITLMDEGMELALGFHAGNNLIGAMLVTADWTVFKTNSVLKDVSEPVIGFDVLIPVLVMYPIFILIMAKKYKWNNWKERLFGKVEQPLVAE